MINILAVAGGVIIGFILGVSVSFAPLIYLMIADLKTAGREPTKEEWRMR